MNGYSERVDPATLPAKPKSLRQSFVSLAASCAHAAYLSVKEGEARGHALERGSAFHEFADRASKVVVEEGEVRLPPDLAKTIAQEVLDSWPGNMPAHEMDVVRACAHSWAEATEFDPDYYVGSELPLTLDLGELEITGTIDRLDILPGGHAVVSDYKSSLGMPSLDTAAQKPQLRTYATLLAFGTLQGETEKFGSHLETFECRFLFPRVGIDPETGGLASRTFWLDRGELLDHKLDLQAIASRLARSWETGFFPATTGSHCSFCPIRSECPIPDAEHPYREQIQSAEDAQAAAEQYIHLKVAADAARQAVKGWVDDHGPVDVGSDMIAATDTVQRAPSLDKEKLRATVEDSKRFGTPLELDPFFAKKTATKFSIRRKREDE